MSILELLNLGQIPDLQRMDEGYVAIHEPDLGKFAYKITVNDPLPTESIEKVVEFGSGADPDLIRHLYRLCNGLWIAKFAVYGLRSGPCAQQPWDINVPNYFERPAKFPGDFLIVGANYERDRVGSSVDLSHCITADGRIVVIELEEPETNFREYRSIENWLQSEAARALAA